MGIQIVKLLDKINNVIITGGLIPRAEYVAETAYVLGDFISYEGSSYVALGDTTGNLPTNTTYWQVVASMGIQGIQGDAATITVGTVTTGAPGSEVTFENVGTPGDAEFDISIPEGDKGDTGASITSGAFVNDDLVLTKDDDTTVTIVDAKIDLKGDQGIQGIQGEIGLPNVLTIGTVTKAVDPSAEITGTSPEQVLNLVLPQGDQGIQGEDGEAVQLQVADGYIQWKYTSDVSWTNLILVSTLVGDTGASITSAAFVANDLVFTKDDDTTVTIIDAKLALKGDTGETGETGATGAGITPQAVGFTITGGTTPKTLIVELDASVSGSNTGDQTLPVKSNAAETDAVTDDSKFVTSLTARKFTAAPASDHLASGNKVVLNANENQAFGDVCFINVDGQAQIGDADAIATSSCVAMCADATISANADGNYLLLGFARDDTWAWTVGGLIYLTVTGTSGNTLSQTAPTGTDDVVQVMGVATHADRMYFNPQLVQVEKV